MSYELVFWCSFSELNSRRLVLHELGDPDALASLNLTENLVGEIGCLGVRAGGGIFQYSAKSLSKAV